MRPLVALRWHSVGRLALSSCVLPVGILFAVLTVALPAQTSPGASAQGGLAFDVVSIRLNKTNVAPEFGPTPSGYRVTAMPLLLPIITAYVPTTGTALFSPGSVVGTPAWAKQDRFDIEAKVSEGDLANWQKPDLQPAMMRSMLQAMLKDRFKLEVHREMKEVPVYSLVIAKNGPKLKETVPGEVHPGGRKLPGGDGVMVVDEAAQTIHFYETSMSTLAFILGDKFTGRPVQDKTGLTGHYDFEIHIPGKPDSGSPQEGVTGADSGPGIFSDLGDLGLKLESTKGQQETLIIDHLERPTEN
jgi:uncharacterized protein (TIGR03435 family)